jgi:hypothetical protein
VYVNVRLYARLLVLRAREMPATTVKSSENAMDFLYPGARISYGSEKTGWILSNLRTALKNM